jgi:hypothetical protein
VRVTGNKNLPTGGQVNVAGILYQMLVSLADGLETTVSEYTGSAGPSPVVLHVEPFDGGDVQILARRRLVVQVKTRAAHRSWTSGRIIDEVLPDLFQAAGLGPSTEYQFVTDNDSGCGEFRRFLAWFRSRATTPHVASPTFRLGRGGRRVTAETVLKHVADKLDPSRADDAKVELFLGSLEIVRRSGVDLVSTINRYLRQLVERPEDIRHKRKQLIGELVDLGSSGTAATTSHLLEAAGLDPRRLMLASLLPRLLEQRLLRTLELLRYDAESDVRGPLTVPRVPLTVLRGESGLGKSWRMYATARSMATAGRPVVLIRAAADLEALRAGVASAVWNPTYSDAAPLPSVAERLRPVFGDGRGVWLTVFLDDLNDPELARRLVEDDWASLGIDIVTSCQPATADWIRRSGAAPDIIDVRSFSVEELARYLEEKGVQYAELPGDVFELLLKPVLARLFCLLPHGISLRPETEYELMNSFWRYAATERASQVRHPFDLDRLQLVIGDMLLGPCAYPLPPSFFVRTIDDAAVLRLMECGMVELDGDRRLSMTHDRLLNWAMAAHLASLSADRNLDAAQLLALVQQVEGLHTTAGSRIGRRLGYVLMDLLWLMLDPGRHTPERAAAVLLAYMRAPAPVADDQAVLLRLLPTLGKRVVPLLRAMAEASFSEGRERLWPTWIAQAMRSVADDAWAEVRAAATTLFRSNDAVQVEIALEVIAKVGADDLLDELLDLNMTRRAAADASTGRDCVGTIQTTKRAFDALARAAEANPAWLDRKIAASTAPAEAEQLLWALLRLDQGSGLPIWQARREHLFRTLGPSRRVLSQAVRTFAQLDDLPRLRLASTSNADPLLGAMTFDAIARLDPSYAIRILRGEEDGALPDLRGTEEWWMRGLHYRTGAELGAALREGARRNDGPGDGTTIARMYGRMPELIDATSVDAILDGLEAALAGTDASGDELVGRSHQVLSLLCSLPSKANLDRVAARRGTRLETALVDVATGRPPSSSRDADWEGEKVARLLAVMAGDGYDRLVLWQIGSTGTTTVEYGLEHALWTSNEAVGQQLDEIAIAGAPEGDGRPYLLMQALAAHGRDAALARLIAQSSPVYLHAVDIRQARSGDTRVLTEQIRTIGASPDLEERARAVDLSHFLEADAAIDLTTPLIASAEPGDAVAIRLLELHLRRRRYVPALLPKLTPLLMSPGEAGARAALHLALHGDAEGRGAAARWLAQHGLQVSWREGSRTAFALLDHEDSRGAAIEYFRLLRDRDLPLGLPDAEILDVLARHGDECAVGQLVDLAFGDGARNVDAVAGAVRIVSARNSHGAFQAARRLFARSGGIEAARLLMVTDPAKGVSELMQAYVRANLQRRLAISRNLRWAAPPSLLLPALAGLANSVMEVERRMAAEIAGWLPHEWDLPWLGHLASDPVQRVEQAAIASVQRRASAGAAQELIGALPSQPKSRQWAYLRTLIDMVDPHLLLHAGDPLDIRPAVCSLPAEFAIEAKRLLDRRRQEVERDERLAARDEQ